MRDVERTTLEQSISVARRAVLDRATADLGEQSWSRAAFVSGSHAATDEPDAWGDIDLRVVVADDAFDSVVADKNGLPRRWGDVVYVEEVPLRHLAIAHYAPFFKLDVFFYTKQTLTPDPHWLLPQRILFDPELIVSEVIAASRIVSHDTGPGLAWSSSRGIAAAEEVVRKLARGQLVFAQHYLTEVRAHLLRALQISRGHDTRAKVFSVLETDKELSALVEESCVGADPAAIAAALRRLLSQLSLVIQTSPDYSAGIQQVSSTLATLGW